jgi:GTP cyclohydrolase I
MRPTMSEISPVSIGDDGRAKREFDGERAERAVRELLLALGEDPERDGLRDTPARVARALKETYAGLWQSPEDVLTTTFDLGHHELVMVRDIEVYSQCEHHLVPFHGVAHVGYIPGPSGRITGISKLARLILEPLGAIVIIDCEHLCMSMRGVRKPTARTVTSAVRGQLRDPATRAEAMDLALGRSR